MTGYLHSSKLYHNPYIPGIDFSTNRLRACRWSALRVCRWSALRICRWSALSVCRWSALRVCRWSALRACRWSALTVCRWSALDFVIWTFVYLSCHLHEDLFVFFIQLTEHLLCLQHCVADSCYCGAGLLPLPV